MNNEHLSNYKLQDKISRNNHKISKANNHPKVSPCPQFKIHCIGSNVSLISEEFAKAITTNNSISNCNNEIEMDDSNFPSLGQQLKHNKRPTKNYSACNSSENNENRFSLQDFFQSKPITIVNEPRKQKPVITPKYSGNPLDSALPVRKSGKFREVPKSKKGGKLKRAIMSEKLEVEQNSEQENSTVELNNLFSAHVVTDDDSVCAFISRVVELQEKLYKRDATKGKSKRRYVVGLHEAKKYLTLNRVKMIIIAGDIKLNKENGVLQVAIQEIVDLSKQNDVFYFLALKRRKLGVLTLKSAPVSCIAVINYEGAEEQFSKLKPLLIQLQSPERHASATQDIRSEHTTIEQNKILELLKNK